MEMIETGMLVMSLSKLTFKKACKRKSGLGLSHRKKKTHPRCQCPVYFSLPFQLITSPFQGKGITSPLVMSMNSLQNPTIPNVFMPCTPQETP